MYLFKIFMFWGKTEVCITVNGTFNEDSWEGAAGMADVVFALGDVHPAAEFVAALPELRIEL